MIAMMHAFLRAFGTWLLRRNIMRELHSLDDCILHDIGLSRCDIDALVSELTSYPERRSTA
jgi:uncharacterized protein YjiS (DUF1127 family)